jgi:DNA-binding PadR family transcriptional regulator
MGERKRHTFDENITQVLEYCRIPKTLHSIKDNFYFNNDKLKYVINFLVSSGWIVITELPRDGRHVKQIRTTEEGKVELKSRVKVLGAIAKC